MLRTTSESTPMAPLAMATRKSTRPDFATASPAAFQAMLDLESRLYECGLDPELVEFVNLRVSQLNDCAYGVDVHSSCLRAAGEGEMRISRLDAWRDSPCYSERERAALAWAEAVTRVADGHVPDDVHAMARVQFDERELADLTLAIVAINGWNRLDVAFRSTSMRRQAEVAAASQPMEVPS